LFVTAAEMDVLPPIAGQVSPVSPRSSKFTTGASTSFSPTAFLRPGALFVLKKMNESIEQGGGHTGGCR
jgi:hypothetical protein